MACNKSRDGTTWPRPTHRNCAVLRSVAPGSNPLDIREEAGDQPITECRILTE